MQEVFAAFYPFMVLRNMAPAGRAFLSFSQKAAFVMPLSAWVVGAVGLE
jgi:hypothetical protein